MRSNYFSYLLRLWRSEDSQHNTWHASLEEPNTQQIIHFKSIDELNAFIQEKSVSRENLLLKKGSEVVKDRDL